MKPENRIVTAAWPRSLLAEVRAVAEEEDRSVSSVIRQAVREWLDARRENGLSARG